MRFIRGTVAVVLLSTSLGFAQDKPAPRTRRPVHADTERTPYRLRERAPTTADGLAQVHRWIAVEFFGDAQDAQRSIDALYDKLLLLEAQPRRAAELARSMVPMLRAKFAERRNGGVPAMVRLFREAGTGAEMGFQLGSSRGDLDARRVESLYELFRMSALLVLVAEGEEDRVADEPFTRVERATPSEPERVYREAFLAEYRRR